MNDNNDVIMVDIANRENIKTKKEIESAILKNIGGFLNQLGNNYGFKSFRNRIFIDGHIRHIDFVLYDIDACHFIVGKFKFSNFNKQDIEQVRCFMEEMDKQIKYEYMTPTTGIILFKNKDNFYAKYIRNDI